MTEISSEHHGWGVLLSFCSPPVEVFKKITETQRTNPVNSQEWSLILNIGDFFIPLNQKGISIGYKIHLYHFNESILLQHDPLHQDIKTHSKHTTLQNNIHIKKNHKISKICFYIYTNVTIYPGLSGNGGKEFPLNSTLSFQT